MEEEYAVTITFDNCHRLSFAAFALVWQAALIILFAALTEYGSGAKLNTGSETDMDHYYPLFQDVNVMIFVGFGFLMTFLSKYGFSSVGYNFLISCFTVQWAIIVNGIMHGAFHLNKAGEADPFHADCPAFGATAAASAAEIYNHTLLPERFCIHLSIETLITGDFAAGAVMITFGAVLGKTNPIQMMVVAIVEIIFYAFNENIGAGIFSAVDMGGSIFVHTFGAYFGLALSYTISSSKNPSGAVANRPKNGSSKTSDMFAMIGTLFLWMFWPSFNGALATDEQQHRVVINTVLALCACCITAFAVDAFTRPDNKFDMVSIQNATLAGGVAVGSSSDLVIQPWGALLTGCVAGAVSVLGYVYLDPRLKKIGLDDTCGVHNLHGMPGIMGAIGGAISAATAGQSAYGESIADVFPARADGRTAAEQGGYQLAALAVTLLVSIVGGVVTGFIIKSRCFLYHGAVHEGEEDKAKVAGCCKWGHSMDPRLWYDDKYYWEVPEEHEEEEEHEEGESHGSHTIVPVDGRDGGDGDGDDDGEVEPPQLAEAKQHETE